MTKPLPLIYIAAPFRGSTPYDVRRHVEAARDIGLTVAILGGYPIIPHTMTADFDKQLTDQFWLDGTMELLRRCDAILMGPRWMYSTGATAEREEAKRLGLPIFYSNDSIWERTLRDWVTAWQENTIRLMQGPTIREFFETVRNAGAGASPLTLVTAPAAEPDPQATPAASSPLTSAPAPAGTVAVPPREPGTPAT